MQISCPFQLFKDAELWCGSALCWMLENDTYFGVMSCSLTYCNSFVPTTSRYCRYCLLCPSLTRSSCSQTCLSGEHAAFLPTLLPMWDVTLRLDNSACWINGDEESSVCFIYLVISGLVLCFFFFFNSPFNISFFIWMILKCSHGWYNSNGSNHTCLFDQNIKVKRMILSSQISSSIKI